jgi:hypothetical protein
VAFATRLIHNPDRVPLSGWFFSLFVSLHDIFFCF